MKLSLLERNLAKAQELKPEARWAAEMWILSCDRLGKAFRVAEVFRPQSRQDALYAQGRTTKGPIVTWTRSSKHTLRIAMDVYPVKKLSGEALLKYYSEIATLGLDYGIRRDPALVRLGDYGHFELDAARQKPTPSIPKSESAARRKLERQVRVATEPKKSRLAKRLNAI